MGRIIVAGGPGRQNTLIIFLKFIVPVRTEPKSVNHS